MKNKNEMKQKKYLYTREDTGYCYEITIKKESINNEVHPKC